MVVGAWPTGRPALLAINPAARHAQGQIRSKTGEGSLHAASVESKHLAHGGWGDGFPSLLLAASCAACRRMGVSCPAHAVLVMLSRCPNTYFYVCELHGASTQRRFDPEALRLHFSDGVKVPLLHSTPGRGLRGLCKFRSSSATTTQQRASDSCKVLPAHTTGPSSRVPAGGSSV